MKLIDKDAVLAKIDKRIKVLQKHPMENHKTICHLDSVKQSVNSLEVKEVDFEEELKHYCNDYYNCDYPKQIEEETCCEAMPHIVSATKHFFELGLSASYPITAADRGTAEEIIVNLKRVEQDYRINLTKEIEWVRNQVKK